MFEYHKYEVITMTKNATLHMCVDQDIKQSAEGGPIFSTEEVMQELGITRADIDAAEDLEIE